MLQVQTASGPAALWKNPNFMILWIGQLVSQLGTAIFTFAVVVWVIRTAGAPALGGLMMVAAVPGIIVGPVAGTLVDSLNRKWIIALSDLGLGGLMIGAGLLARGGGLLLVHVYALLIVVNVVEPLFRSAVSAVLPSVVHGEQLSRANSVRQAAASGTGLVGPALAALLLATLGGVDRAIPLYFLINGISFAISGATEAFLVIPDRPKRSGPAGAVSSWRGFWTQMVEGLGYVFRSGAVTRLVIILAAINFFLAPLGQVVIPGAVVDVLEMDEVWLGFIQSGIAGGFLLASIILSMMKQKSMFGLVIAGAVGMGVSVSGIGVSMALPVYTPVPVAVSGLLMITFGLMAGSSAAVASIALSTIMQTVVPDEMRGRVFAFMNTCISGLRPLSLGTAGALAAVVPLFLQPAVGGVAIASSSLLLRKARGIEDMAQVAGGGANV